MTVRNTALLVALVLAFPTAALAGGARKAPLTRPAADAPDADAKGFIKLKGRSGAELFSVKCVQLDASADYTVYVEDGVGLGLFTLVDTISANADGSAKFQVNTRRGDELPLGVLVAEDLAGRIVEVRRDDGLLGELTVLSGVIPDPSAKREKPRSAQDDLDASETHEGECDGRVYAKSTPGTQLLKVKLKHAVAGSYGVFMDDGTGAYFEVGAVVVAEGETSGSWQVVTARGDPLPFDAQSVRDLAGRAVEVRDADGAVVLEGSVPDIDVRGKGKGKDKGGKPEDKPGKPEDKPGNG